MDTNPFTTAPNPNQLYVTASLGRILDKVRYVVDSRQGLTVIYGAIGLGKSTVMRFLHSEYDARGDCAATFLPSPNYKSELGLLKAICGEFGLASKRAQIDQESELRRFLLGLYAEDKNCVVFIDEAQLLKGHVLELVRSLLNFESNTDKLINIVLCGQLELHARLADPSKEALRSRIILYSNLDPLALDETEKMIAYRCERAGVPNPFAPEVVAAIYQRSKGVPREVLKYAGAAFHLARRNRLEMVPLELVEMVAPDVAPLVPA